ncbi:MAG TPA: peptidoglycan-binding protein [Solirubrobacteraceae bacterium]|nr:peptidoglycan-binding protein [Solirubrobacteraceae bacterium]
MQVALRALGLYDGAVDGIVGPQTRAALVAAQRRARLPETGVATRRTRWSLGPLGRPEFGTRLLERGDFGLDVSTLQFMLERRSLYHGALDGYFDRLTQRAVQRFQREANLVPDGIVGVHTARALTLRPAPAARAPQPAAGPAAVRARLDAWSARLGVSAPLVRALAWMESGYQPRLVSAAGARGVLQLLPSTRRYVQQVLVGHPLPQTLDGEIEAGVLLLRHLLQRFGGNQRLALAAWYQGEGAVRRHGIYAITRPFVADVLALEARM